MKKLFLSVIALYAGMLASFSQNSQPGDSAYKPRKLTFQEANLVSSYYSQDGNNAAVTGGIGSEKLSDIANTIDLKFFRYDKQANKHNVTFELGIDHYTSASSDKIDPSTVSSASHADSRYYPSIGWTKENEKKGSTIGAGISYSAEYDYQSLGINVNFLKKLPGRGAELSGRLQTYIDHLSLIYPIELRNQLNGGTASRNTFDAAFSWSQIINTKLQLMLEGEAVYQRGYLGLPFHRVYFNNNSVHVEALPSSRWKVPLGLRANYFLGDKFIVRTWYRNYHDTWGIHSNAAQIETVIKFTPFFSLTPFYRFYQQSAVHYFAAFGVHTSSEEFFTSNYDLSKFNSHFFGAGFRAAPPQGLFHIQHLHSIEVRYGHYHRTTGMNSDIVSMNIRYAK
jgi:hypothetical protein